MDVPGNVLVLNDQLVRTTFFFAMILKAWALTVRKYTKMY